MRTEASPSRLQMTAIAALGSPGFAARNAASSARRRHRPVLLGCRETREARQSSPRRAASARNRRPARAPSSGRACPIRIGRARVRGGGRRLRRGRLTGGVAAPRKSSIRGSRDRAAARSRGRRKPRRSPGAFPVVGMVGARAIGRRPRQRENVEIEVAAPCLPPRQIEAAAARKAANAGGEDRSQGVAAGRMARHHGS